MRSKHIISRLLCGLVLLCVAHGWAWGQDHTDNCCQRWQDYVPEHPEYWPIKRVRLVAHIIVPPDSSHIFPDTVDGRYKIMGLVNDATYKYRHLQPMYLAPEAPVLPDGRVEFVLEYEHVLYHPRADWDWSVHTTHAKRVRAVQALYNELVRDNPGMVHRQDAIHVFFVERSQASARRMFEGVASGVGNKDWMLMLDTWHAVSGGNWPNGLVAHELGHNLGLLHTTTKVRPLNDGCEDTPTYPVNIDCWNGDTCSNNIMDYNANATNLSPCQLGKVHLALAGKAGNMHMAVIPDWCTYRPDHTTHIPAQTRVEWCGERRLWGDVVLQPGSTLQVNCAVYMPPGARIIVAPGAQLILAQQGRITHQCGEGSTWHGVILRKKGRHIGSLTLRTQATVPLENATHPQPLILKKAKHEAFNIRVYGILCTQAQEVLLVEEQHHNLRILKFPGGGLEHGEGVTDCLQREWLEETQTPLTAWQHFYTTEFYQPSAFDANDQIISIYYRVQSARLPTGVPPEAELAIKAFHYRPLASLHPHQLTMPIDQVVLQKLKAHEGL